MREQQALHGQLAGQVDRPLGVPDPPRVCYRAPEPARRQVARELPQGVQRDDDSGFAQEGTPLCRPAPGAPRMTGGLARADEHHA